MLAIATDSRKATICNIELGIFAIENRYYSATFEYTQTPGNAQAVILIKSELEWDMAEFSWDMADLKILVGINVAVSSNDTMVETVDWDTNRPRTFKTSMLDHVEGIDRLVQIFTNYEWPHRVEHGEQADNFEDTFAMLQELKQSAASATKEERYEIAEKVAMEFLKY